MQKQNTHKFVMNFLHNLWIFVLAQKLAFNNVQCILPYEIIQFVFITVTKFIRRNSLKLNRIKKLSLRTHYHHNTRYIMPTVFALDYTSNQHRKLSHTWLRMWMFSMVFILLCILRCLKSFREKYLAGVTRSFCKIFVKKYPNFHFWNFHFIE